MPRLLLSAVTSFLLLAASISAPAAVVYSGLQEIVIPNDFEGIYLNVFSGNVSSTEPGNWSSAPVINPFFGGTAIGTSALLRPAITGTDQIENLAYGSTVGSASSFAAGENGSSSHVGAAANQFQLGVEGYLGFAFEAFTGGPTMYGVMRLTIDNNGTGAVIHDWTYDNAGSPVAVPEPGRLLLLAFGLGVTVLHRRRR